MQKEGNITWQGSQGTHASTPPRQLGIVHHRQVALLPQQVGLAFPRQEAALPRQLTLQLRQLGLAGSFSLQEASANSPNQTVLPREEVLVSSQEHISRHTALLPSQLTTLPRQAALPSQK